MDPVIRARGLSRSYPLGEGHVTGLDAVDLDVAPGALVVLKGHSGSGKSTLLALLAGLDRPTAGTLTVAGRDLTTADDEDLTAFRREAVGMVFQTFNLMPTLSVLENACLPALLAGREPAASRAKARGLLAWLGLEHRLAHRPAQLSGGEMQRAAIARALINDPPLILADEPTGNLDSASGARVTELLGRLHDEQGRTVVIATHADMADALATQRVLLRDGRIVEDAKASG